MASAQLVKEKGMYHFKPFIIKHLVPKTDLVPKGRSGHRIVSDNACVYSFGGFSPQVYDHDSYGPLGNGYGSKLFQELWKFNIAKQEWEKLDHFWGSMPKQLASCAVLMKGDLLIVHGGTGMPFGYSSTNKTYIANLKSGTSFSLVPARGRPPVPRYGQATVLDGHCLYVVGGTTGFDYSIDVHRLNLKNMIWEEIYLTKEIPRAEPQGRYRHEIVLQDSKIMIFGGGTDLEVFRFTEVPAFDLETKTWENMTTFPNKRPATCIRQYYPPSRRCHGCVHLPGDEGQDPEVVICGGFDGIEILQDVWRLNLRTFDWFLCESILPDPLYFHATSLSPNGQMFIFGGISESPIGRVTYRSNKIFSFWTMIPKLKEICWEAIRHYCPDLSKFTDSELIQAGVPIDFVERLNS